MGYGSRFQRPNITVGQLIGLLNQLDPNYPLHEVEWTRESPLIVSCLDVPVPLETTLTVTIKGYFVQNDIFTNAEGERAPSELSNGNVLYLPPSTEG
jgi:hypothetical protein